MADAQEKNWNRYDRTGDTELVIQGHPLPMLGINQSYKYLGYQISLSNTAGKTQTASVVREFRQTLDNRRK